MSSGGCRLGAGAYGTVYLGTCETSERLAVKRLLTDAEPVRRQFRTEVEVMSRLVNGPGRGQGHVQISRCTALRARSYMDQLLRAMSYCGEQSTGRPIGEGRGFQATAAGVGGAGSAIFRLGLMFSYVGAS